VPSTPPELEARPSLPSASARDLAANSTERPVTELLRAWGAGDARASEALVRLVYTELRRQAHLALQREGDGHTLQPTALVHEAWLRLADQRAQWESRAQFFAIAAQTMRRVLVDHARTRRALKRGAGAVQVSLADADREMAGQRGPVSRMPLDAVDVLALDDALARLAVLDPLKARLVDLRYFAGFSIPEASAALGISPATVGREWAVARMWLRRELER
jgi:RNA polymerase sigma factor (TIGR02999 family)